MPQDRDSKLMNEIILLHHFNFLHFSIHKAIRKPAHIQLLILDTKVGLLAFRASHFLPIVQYFHNQ